MKQLIAVLSLCLFSSSMTVAQKATPDIATKTKGMKAHEGFFTYYWDEAQGKIWLEIKNFDEEFLYVNSLSAGVGSNDIGLDRNQLGGTRVVSFKRVGPKVLMVQPNLDYRAVSDNPDERESVADAFARSVIWGANVEAAEEGRVLVDLSSLLMADAHNIADRLRGRGEGSFKVDTKRSAVHLDRTKNFPKNSEFEAWVTFTGNPQGRNLRSVTPNGKAVSVRLHHSFIELPDDNYKPRVFHPGSGYNALTYADYATPISQSLVKRFIRRHRLEKKDPTAALSEAVEPIVYYLDRGAPEPIRSALIEGASWWNQAFEAAGYKDAFQVKLLPAGADPLDVRYNVINWVHRSTRGWSYGSSVTDPRTGEIIKGHVHLGSLRVRQDFMIAQGLVAAYENGETPDPRLEQMALARLRQLSAHEVGHTLGIVHNFAASVNDRASVMDYPHPYIAMTRLGKMDFDGSYAVGIGDWDKRVIIYGYQDYPEGVDEKTELDKVIQESIDQGFHFITDRDARPPSGANPLGHLWDNGVTAVGELKRLNKVRAQGLANFSEKNIPVGAPMGTLENVLVPLYLMHRYQVEAVSKVIGGVNYTYASRGDGQVVNEPISPSVQKEALSTLLITLDPDFLQVPDHIIKLIPPQPPGYFRGRELFKTHTDLSFDPLGAAESSADYTLRFLLNSARLARLVEQRTYNADQLSVFEVMDRVRSLSAEGENAPQIHNELKRIVRKLFLHHVLQLAGDRGVMSQVSAAAWLQLDYLKKEAENVLSSSAGPDSKAHQLYILQQIDVFEQDPSAYKVPKVPSLPDGSPIGCGDFH